MAGFLILVFLVQLKTICSEKNFYEKYIRKLTLQLPQVSLCQFCGTKKTETIVNNESSQIIRILNTAFNDLTGNHIDFYPQEKRIEIDELNDMIYNNVNNGVYKSGFAVTQSAYDDAVTKLFKTLDYLDEQLSHSKFLVGDEITEADLRLIPTLLRFDAVYVTHFKCNIRRIVDYKNLHRYMQDMLEVPAIKDTCNIDHIKRHYYYSHEQINPYRIIPKGPKAL
jgi:putative glutathione S-transferase